MIRFQITLEELGHKLATWIDLDLEYDEEPYEPAVMYFANGDGYPGNEGGIVIVDVHATAIGGDDWEVKREDRPGWFGLIDDIAYAAVMEDRERWEEHISERLAERDEAARCDGWTC